MGLIRACLSCLSGKGATDLTVNHARPVGDTQVETAPTANSVSCATSPAQECSSVQAVRDQLVLECSTSIISAFALGDGRLIYQNNLSKAWFSGHGEQGSCLTRRADSPVPGTVPTSASVPWGGLHIPVPPLSQASGSHADHGEVGLVLGPSESAAGGRVTEGCTAHMLAHVFALEPQKLACMLQELSQSGSGNWKGVIRVPAVPLPAGGTASARQACTQLTSTKGPASAPMEERLALPRGFCGQGQQEGGSGPSGSQGASGNAEVRGRAHRLLQLHAASFQDQQQAQVQERGVGLQLREQQSPNVRGHHGGNTFVGVAAQGLGTSSTHTLLHGTASKQSTLRTHTLHQLQSKDAVPAPRSSPGSAAGAVDELEPLSLQKQQQQDACLALSPRTRARARQPYSASGASQAASQHLLLVPWQRSWAEPSSRPPKAPATNLAAPNRPLPVAQHSSPSAASGSGARPPSSAPLLASPSPKRSSVTAGEAAAARNADPWDVAGARAASGSHAANIPSGSARYPSSSRLPSLAASGEAGHSLALNPIASGALATSTLGLTLEREPSLVKPLELRKLEAAALAFAHGPGGLHKHHAQHHHSPSPQQQSPEPQARRLHAAVGSRAPSPQPTTSGTWLTHQLSTEFPAQLADLLGAQSQPLTATDALLSWGRDRDSAACSAASGRPSASRAPVVPSGASHRTSGSPLLASVRLHDLLSYKSFTTPIVSPSDPTDAAAAGMGSGEAAGAAKKEMVTDPATHRGAWEQQCAGRQDAEEVTEDKDPGSHAGLLPPPTISRPSSVLPNLLQLLPPLLEADERSGATSGGGSSGPSSTTKLSIRLVSVAARTRSSSYGRSNTPLPCAPRLDRVPATGGAAGHPALCLSALESEDATADAGALGPWVLGPEEGTEHDAMHDEPFLLPPPPQQPPPRPGRAASSSGTCSTSAAGTWGNTRASSFLTHNTDSHAATTGHSSPNSKTRALLSHFPRVSSPGVRALGCGPGTAAAAVAAPHLPNSPAAPVQLGPGAVVKGHHLIPCAGTGTHAALPVATVQLPRAATREDEGLSWEPMSGLSPSEEAVAPSPFKAAAVPLTRQQRSSWQGYPPCRLVPHGAEAGPSEVGGGAGYAGNSSGRGVQGRTVAMWELDAWTVAALRSLPRSQTSTADVTAHIPEDAAPGRQSCIASDRHAGCARAACHGQEAEALGELSRGRAGGLPAAGAVSGCAESIQAALLPLSGPTGQQSGVSASVAAGVDGRGGAPAHRWHRVTARRAVDPVTGEPVVVLVQDDVTAKVLVESHLALVMEAEHRLLEQLFPQRVLRRLTEGLVKEQRQEAAEQDAAVARAVGAAFQGFLPGRTQSVKALGAPCGERTTPRGGRVSRPGDLRPSGGRRGSLQGSLPAPCLGLGSLATHHPCVTLLQSDVKGFTPMAKDVPPHVVMAMLNDLFSRFDALLDVYGVRKIETIGDAYVVAGGLASDDDQENDEECAGVGARDSTHSSSGRQLSPRSASNAADAAYRVFCFAKAMLRASRQVLMPHTGRPVEIRVGMHSGPVVSGVVGSNKPKYCLFGATMAATSRLESGGEAGAVHLSATCRQLVESRERGAQWAPGPGVEGKGGPLASFLYRL